MRYFKMESCFPFSILRERERGREGGSEGGGEREKEKRKCLLWIKKQGTKGLQKLVSLLLGQSVRYCMENLSMVSHIKDIYQSQQFS
jgi:hypothetical protein